jgi:hypothetical protein
MGYTRPFQSNKETATTVFCGSVAGGQLIVPANPYGQTGAGGRAVLRLQPLTDAFRLGPVGSMNASSPVLVPSGTVYVETVYCGPVFALPAGGATAAIGLWESSF